MRSLLLVAFFAMTATAAILTETSTTNAVVVGLMARAEAVLAR